MRSLYLRGKKGDGAEGVWGHSIDHQLQINVIIWKIDKIRPIEDWKKFLLQKLGIPGPDPESDQSPDIAKNSAPYLFF